MSRKNQNFMAGLAEDPTEDVAEPLEALQEPVRRQIGTSVTGPNSVIAGLASGKSRQVLQKLVDPARCRIWPGNARVYSRLDMAACQELIDSIIAENGQKVPAIVRKISDDPDFDYEVLVGTRRHWSISWLRANNYPELMFLVQPELLTDEAAFRLADLENRPRADVSGYERAVNYAAALIEYYDGQSFKMADRLNIPRGTLSRLLAVAKLPTEIAEAYASYSDILIKPWYAVTSLLDDDREARARVIGEARQIISEQADLAERAQPKLEGPVVTARLMAAINGSAKVGRPAEISHFLLGTKKLVSITGKGRKGLDLKIHKVEGATRTDIIDRVNAALDAAGMD